MHNVIALSVLSGAAAVAFYALYVTLAGKMGRILAALRRQQSQPMMASKTDRWRRMHLEADRRAASARKGRGARRAH